MGAVGVVFLKRRRGREILEQNNGRRKRWRQWRQDRRGGGAGGKASVLSKWQPDDLIVFAAHDLEADQ